MLPPERFEEALRNYDRALSLRWGHVVNCWVIERSCFVSEALLATLTDGMKKAINLMALDECPPDKRYMLQKACEEGYSAGFGKRVVIYARQLDNRVFDALMLTDLQAAGNLQKAINSSVNREKQKKRDRYNAYEPLGREVESVVDFGLRKKTSQGAHDGGARVMADAFKKEPPLDAKKHFDTAPRKSTHPLFDGFGRELNAKRNVKIELGRA